MGATIVPMVSYERGQRFVIGEATVSDDGTIEAKIEPGEHGAIAFRMLQANEGIFAIDRDRGFDPEFAPIIRR